MDNQKTKYQRMKRYRIKALKIISKIVLILITLSYTNCSDDNDLDLDLDLEFTNLKTIEIGDYKLEFPSQFQLIEGLGIDSYVGKVVGSGIELTFDFGVFTNPHQNLPENRFEVINETFGSVERQIVIGLNPREDFTGIHIRDLNNFSELGNFVSLSMSTVDITQEQQDLVVQILESTVLIE